MLPSDYRLALQALNKGPPLVLDNHNKLAPASGRWRRTGEASIRNHNRKSQPGRLFGRLIGRASERNAQSCLRTSSTAWHHETAPGPWTCVTQATRSSRARSTRTC